MRLPRDRPGDTRKAGDHSAYPTILALVGYYPPAYRAGGPTRSVPPIAELLKHEFEFLVVTRDRDLGAKVRLAGVVSDRWVECGSARCLYLSARRRLRGGLIAAVRTRHEILYVNSIFTFEFSVIPLLLRRFGLIPRRGLVVAPRGELDDSALAIKRRRKSLYLRFVRALRLTNGAIWHAATQDEAEAVRRHFGARTRVLIARDIPIRPGPETRPTPKQAGTLDMVFLGRVARIKNLDFAISALTTLGGRVTFNVFGPMEDRQYWDECLNLSHRLPSNVKLEYRGQVEPDATLEVLGRHHLMFLPTRAESFGHAIVESLIAGCPVLISDQTPWHDLEARRAGWEFPLSRPDQFRAVLERCVDMTQEEFDTWSAGARSLGREIADDPARDAAYRGIFAAALDPGDVALVQSHGQLPVE